MEIYSSTLTRTLEEADIVTLTRNLRTNYALKVTIYVGVYV